MSDSDSGGLFLPKDLADTISSSPLDVCFRRTYTINMATNWGQPVSDIAQMTFQEATEFFSRLPLDVQGQLRTYFISEAQKADVAQAKAVLDARKRVEALWAHCKSVDALFEELPPYIQKELILLIDARCSGLAITQGIEAWLKGERG